MSDTKTKTKWWLAATLSPVIPVTVGILVAVATPQNQDDWLGFRFAFLIMVGLVLGCILALVFLAVSYLKNEEKTGYAFYALLLMAFIVALASGHRR